MAERTPKVRASYDAVATTPRTPVPPTTTGLPRSDGLSRCSTEAKKASRSRCSNEGSRRTLSLLTSSCQRRTQQWPGCAPEQKGVHGYLAGQPLPSRRHLRRCRSELCDLLRGRHRSGTVPYRREGRGEADRADRGGRLCVARL